MKNIVFIFLFSFSLMSYSQEYGSGFTKATVKSNVSNDTIAYSFISNYLIDEYKVSMLENRLLGRYSELIEINISYSTQIVSFKILSSGSKVFLEKFVKHFKYNGYELV